jgi:hypothetical protein
MKQLIPLQDIDALRSHGIYFKSEGAARWVERTAQFKGLTEAFVRVGSRVFIDPDKYHELARANNSRGARAPIAPPKGRASSVPVAPSKARVRGSARASAT